jgi:RNA polymerase sigma-70 factor, ECF subfamily
MTIRRRRRVDHTEADNLAIKRCLEGDKDAFTELVDRYQRRGISIAYGYVHNYDDAQDMVQEAFVRSYKGLNRFEPGSSFSAWFGRIVVNVCIDHYRKQKKRTSVEYDDSYIRRDAINEHSFVGTTRDLEPHHRSEQEELREALDLAINKLSEKHRTIIILREIDDLSYEEIAEVIQCSLGTVMSRLHHARKNLQEALRPYLKAIGELHLADQAGEGVGTKRTSKIKDSEDDETENSDERS